MLFLVLFNFISLHNLAFDPVIFSHFWIRIATFWTCFAPLVEWIMTTSSASYMYLLSCVFTHWSSAFCHVLLSTSLLQIFPLFYTGGGDIITTLSPLTTIVPKSDDLPSTISTASSSNKFMCWSKPWRVPLITLPPFNLISTIFPKLSSKTFTAISIDNTNSTCYYQMNISYILKFHSKSLFLLVKCYSIKNWWYLFWLNYTV